MDLKDETKLSEFFGNAFREVMLPILEDMNEKIMSNSERIERIDERTERIERKLDKSEDKLDLLI
ncbi:MAG: hypothetical protein US96_C0012G0018 [Candidatus Woesebacteria bacterium GW2011_GWB1_38_5b]|uniref:Uncharacterized protein n=1 Tax=Candidatus Woesebacteria bacterium GW2011_GWB1_38_5b TaxID=1618569 RepID=A0A0G0MNY1_9BACT|nr:MAG: hypothetical protein US96_C0012G0018 [Candidatus Woesebacteria bacterium GW2011_GWB1_38_5b]